MLAEVIHTTSSLSVWEAVAVIGASAVTVLGFLGLIARRVWKKVIGAQLAAIKRMLEPNGLDTSQVGDATARLERDLRENHAKTRKQINAQGRKLTEQIRGLGARLDEHLIDADHDKIDFEARLARKQDRVAAAQE